MIKSFLLSFGINFLFNTKWLIPAVITFVFHFIFGISMWWTFGAVMVFITVMVLRTLLLVLLNNAGNLPEKQRPNKNPYSSKGYEQIDNNKNN